MYKIKTTFIVIFLFSLTLISMSTRASSPMEFNEQCQQLTEKNLNKNSCGLYIQGFVNALILTNVHELSDSEHSDYLKRAMNTRMMERPQQATKSPKNVLCFSKNANTLTISQQMLKIIAMNNVTKVSLNKKILAFLAKNYSC